MNRTRHSNNLIWIALGALCSMGLVGCGKPMLYHFKHYDSPLSAVARSNKTYFHSSKSGKIIEKDPCATYCEPGCFGYEPTTWTHWPSQCPGNFPIQGGPQAPEAVMPYDGQVITDSEVIMDSAGIVLQESATPSQPNVPTPAVEAPIATEPVPSTNEPVTPVVPAETRLPAIRVPSIPADVESAGPSPSDATIRLPEVTLPAIAKADAPAIEAARPKALKVEIPSTDSIVVDVPAPAAEDKPESKIAFNTANDLTPPIKVPSASQSMPSIDLTPEPVHRVAELPAPLGVNKNGTAKPTTTSRRSSKPIASKLRAMPAPKAMAPVQSVVTVEDKPALTTPVAKKVSPPDTARPKIKQAKTLSDKLKLRAGVTRPKPRPTAVPAATRLKLGTKNQLSLVQDVAESKVSAATAPRAIANSVKPLAKSTSKSTLKFAKLDVPSKSKSSPLKINAASANKSVKIATTDVKPAAQSAETPVAKQSAYAKPSADKLTSDVPKTKKAATTLKASRPSIEKVARPKTEPKPKQRSLNLENGKPTVIRFADRNTSLNVSRISAQQDSVLRIVK